MLTRWHLPVAHLPPAQFQDRDRTKQFGGAKNLQKREILMAILKKRSRRIGNFDIRIKLPRDKSLVDVAKDPRLQRQQEIQLQYINADESRNKSKPGFARNNRYLIVRINPPERVVLELKIHLKDKEMMM